MGSSIASSIEEASDLKLAGVWKRGDDLDRIVDEADVLVDFSLPEALDEVLSAALRRRIPLVCGVSGLNISQLAALDQAALAIPIVYDRNMSLGIAVLERVVKEAAAALGPDFAVQISETHHIHKKDAPSGTAMKLAEAVAEARGESGTDWLNIESHRVGEVPGDHDLVMHTDTERLTFAHSVTTREVFVAGTLRAAKWVVGRPAGRYAMADVLFRK